MAVNLSKYFAGTLLVLVIATILSILLVQRSQMVRSNQPTTSGSFE